MIIEHAVVKQSFTVQDAAGDIEIRKGQILMGESYNDIFVFPLTTADGNGKIELAEPLDFGRVELTGKTIAI